MPSQSFRLRTTIQSLLLIGMLTSSGCDSINEGLNDFASSITPTSPREAAESALDQNDPDKRREGIVLLSNAHFGGEQVYVDLYREYVRFDSDPMVLAAAIGALARHGEPSDSMYLIPHFEDASMPVRWEVAKGLQRLHNPQAINALIRVVGDEEEHADVRSAAAIALGQYPNDTVVQVLVSALDARELLVNRAALQSLHTLTGQDFGFQPRAWLDWYNQALAQGTAFRGQQEYFYPTYRRKLSWIENMAFWSKPTFEQPGTPMGLTPLGERSTYQDEETTPQVDEDRDPDPQPGG